MVYRWGRSSRGYYIGYQMFFVGCPSPTIVKLGVLLLVPGEYLALMYLTLTSQK